MKLTIEDIKPYLLFESIAGSRSHNLATETSDTDIKGVFYLPKDLFYGLEYTPQVSNETNDIVYYELGRFVELLCVSNPNILELLNSPEHMVIYRHPLMSLIKPEWFLSKTCVQTFVHYAQGQIKKAQGLNKKIVNPVDKKLKNILDFCYVIEDGKTIQVNSWLDNRHWKQEYIGLAKLAHAQDLYAMYYDEISLFQGIMKKETANDVLLSSIPKKAKVQGYLSFNKEGYSAYRKQYHDYWLWVERRNNARYQQNIDHGRSYDSKNMMHTFRLLYVALGIAQENKVKVWCDNRDDLLAIKAGKFSYDELLERSERLIKDIKKAFQLSALPDEINHSIVKNTLINIRKELYK
ncbi:MULTISPECIES: DNA polymerase beta superfamily protein [Proteus]|uniref:Predicted nucleotidyltransferase n=1 Tax=Proteus vulgaris TaxID=585 RepID=A0A379FD43_PROVU|nr:MULTISPECIES: nucleotidyltransferase domain-containing protein [Proteus]MBG5971820.1 nucleotidyltransferase domain-containing protein [Proteus vulgaris]MDM3558897.1 nucleotidyltransferase domain-containing protein [Proteus vulgaris]MDM3563209.1 nucleotidyltransferase domain-containing protein [Proteus vulgaris]NBN86569.1 nucleotidyltransferase [Proteus sp. G2300]UBH60462.1 nucleotidyltransferase domain-containing protein [Proteus vulgaris]